MKWTNKGRNIAAASSQTAPNLQLHRVIKVHLETKFLLQYIASSLHEHFELPKIITVIVFNLGPNIEVGAASAS